MGVPGLAAALGDHKSLREALRGRRVRVDTSLIVHILGQRREYTIQVPTGNIEPMLHEFGRVLTLFEAWKRSDAIEYTVS